jgi:hypothetical protein
MKKVIFFSVILVLALATVGWAAMPATGPRITYGGYVEHYPQSSNVIADTLICVFNPNEATVTNVGIAVFDKDGLQVADAALLDHGVPITSIQPKAWAWTTLGRHVPPGPATKYTFVVYWKKPGAILTPNRGLVIEIKEILFTEPVYPGESAWMPNYIRSWSEAAIGKGGTGYSTK